ncbi:MAG: exodeoxyribonuclease VII small subunit [Candidatus Schekmanbacteria bacterium RIFCSPHIGHO2_02_FULL_38_11]|uniref:Exodeoxyribonuclease 7 small subunit n=1 Tax=Candidatus Schekmanbacteria bacterium RIFCSPLOWO2_12_FULL_38_15 TaxID=1817883 RepID=A0A1F7SGS7_9BACT|nr:MAG: exodeoxyribonuclease VII small subunit [Candidatus Schekmanbacteria bacterium GWA2_38_9]OGL49616.1 MAG: exodeoxyribonuclease VII small subunit [Candidatus Schekmanbacteria bacterium RIFCSPLOWO2_02_FULL_38_14]OGL50338.1 MAG: exodeoxyribonuclease VII small subunit [Candidatus Schekmanbacteria bacterium RIFCSPHIGHO2_02_FULL_38_11]OGL52969.1 MAG: exodeoxyribonuclease VII small subunit [Candidatus Schekmanbacteria bacterium RIFCSPLOWO2_12_FULL_38_15]
MGNEIKFEDAFGKLEIIVKKLEEGNLNLEESMRLFEEGINLSKVCASKLEEAEKKVEILIKGENGSNIIKPFDELNSEESDE